MVRRRSIAVIIVMLLVIGACSDSGDLAMDDPGRLILWNDASINVLEAGDLSAVETNGTVSQVTAGPDGALVWTRIELNPPSVDAVIAQETRVTLDTPTVPFFYQWNPTGDRIALLGNAQSGGGLLFGLIDVEAEELTTIQIPPPFFVDWSPDGTSLIAHAGGSTLSIVDAETGEAVSLQIDSGVFPAPLWTERGIVVAIATGPTIGSPIVPVGLQSVASEVVLIDPSDASRMTLASVEEPVRIFAGDDALALAVGVAGTQRIEVIGWDGQPRATLGQGSIELLQWSPDGSTLLWTQREADGALIPFTWADGEAAEYEAFRPSAEFDSAYLPFWDQYDRTLSVWAPNSSAFALPTSDGVVVTQLDGESSTYSNWDMAAWTVSTQGN